jgi:hypothetical protein
MAGGAHKWRARSFGRAVLASSGAASPYTAETLALHRHRKEGAKLVPEPTADDPFVEEAYRLWQIKQQGK